MATTKMPSSLEIAQQATLRPITEIAEEIGLRDDEVELYGRYKAKVDLSVLDRLRDHPDQGRRGEDHHLGQSHPGPRQDRQATGALPPGGVPRPRVRDQGRGGR